MPNPADPPAADVCGRYGVPLKAAAIQFPLRRPAVTCLLSGGRSADEITENVTMAAHPVPGEVWAELVCAARA